MYRNSETKMLELFTIIILISGLAQSISLPPIKVESTKEIYINERQTFTDEESYDFRNLQIDKDDGALYVGSTNKLYKLNIYNISQKLNELDMSPEPLSLEKCMVYNGVSRLCQNAIRVFENVNATHMFVCGTNAYWPMCSYVDKVAFKEIPGTRERGKWRCPYSPEASTHSVMLNGTLFTATGNIASVKSRGVVAKTLNGADDIHTPENDRFVFHDPTFAGAYHVRSANPGQDKIFMFFKELAEEIPTEFLTQSTYSNYRMAQSRVATVCANDQGGTLWTLNKNFATFTKMRINCPAPSSGQNMYEMPYAYNEIYGTYLLENSDEPDNPFVYAIFATPRGAAEASALCVYSMKEIRSSLSTSKYWKRDASGEGGFYSTHDAQDDPHPDECVENTKTLSNKRLNFGKEHPIKFGVIQPDSGSALYQESGKRFRFIVVDTVTRNEEVKDGNSLNTYIVMYLISVDGEIRRVVKCNDDKIPTWNLPTLQVFRNDQTSDQVLSVVKNGNGLIIGTNKTVVRIPFAACNLYTNCRECISVRDPYCYLDSSTNSCLQTSLNQPPHRCILEINEAVVTELCGEPQGIITKEDQLTQMVNNLNKSVVALQTILNEKSKLLKTVHEENSALSGNLSICRSDTDILRRNLAEASKRIQSHSSAQKIAVQLYKDTVYSLNGCNNRADDLTVKYELLRRKYAGEMSKKVKLQKSMNREKKGHQLTKNKLESCKNQLLKKSSVKCGEGVFDCKLDQVQHDADLVVTLRNSITDTETAELPEQPATLEECIIENDILRSSLDDLEVENENLTESIQDMHKVHADDMQLIARLRWLHRTNGKRGTQKCEHTQWFVYQNSRRMFMLHNKRSTFERAAKECLSEGGTIPSFHDAEELRYVNNVLRAFAPNRHFWIGLEKSENGTLTWNDGSTLEDGDLERFPSSQSKRLDNSYAMFDTSVKKDAAALDDVFVDYETDEIDKTEYLNAFTDSMPYCAEVNKFQKWQLIPCDRRRRPLCVKDYPIQRLNVVKPTPLLTEDVGFD